MRRRERVASLALVGMCGLWTGCGLEPVPGEAAAPAVDNPDDDWVDERGALCVEQTGVLPCEGGEGCLLSTGTCSDALPACTPTDDEADFAPVCDGDVLVFGCTAAGMPLAVDCVAEGGTGCDAGGCLDVDEGEACVAGLLACGGGLDCVGEDLGEAPGVCTVLAAPEPGEGDSGPDPWGNEQAQAAGSAAGTAAARQEAVFVTANIGREYKGNRAKMEKAIDRIGDVIGSKPVPKYIGWQEIGGNDPCGNCEFVEIRKRFSRAKKWRNARPRGVRGDSTKERVAVPVTSKGGGPHRATATFVSPGWAKVSATRWVTHAHYPERNLTVLNTHLIAGAWSCKSERAKRRRYWKQGWKAIQDAVKHERQQGRNVIVTGDFNRLRRKTKCNPAWDPKSLHPKARVIGGSGLDYIFAVPAPGEKFVVSKRANNKPKRGKIHIGIDGHDAYWVRGRFKKK